MGDKRPERLIPPQRKALVMHADKIRTANIPAFRLEPKDVVVLVSVIGIAAYIFGFLLGLAY